MSRLWDSPYTASAVNLNPYLTTNVFVNKQETMGPLQHNHYMIYSLATLV